MPDQFELITRYAPPGPVVAAFMGDQSFVRFIMGPQGSGKTGACIADLIAHAARMPICKDGYRRFRVVAVRNTYGDLTKTIESWLDWVPKEKGAWVGGDNRPASHKLFWKPSPYDPPEYRGLHFEIRFLAVGEQRIENVFRGNEFTAGWLNESDLLAPDVYSYMVGRAGRYPPKRLFSDGNSRFRRYIVGDFNAPDIENYLYKICVEDRPDNVAFYHQPSGRAPDAENVENLPEGYYDEQVEANRAKPWWIRRMVDSRWGFSRDGQPVFPEYQDDKHASRAPLLINPDLPLYIGLDAAMHPGAVIGQWYPDGQWKIVHEIVPGRQGPTKFGKHLKVWLNQNAPRAGVAGIYADPTSFYGSDEDDLAWAETVMMQIDREIEPAPTNDLTIRLEAVAQKFTYFIDGDKPSILISPSCKILRKGMNSKYQYRKVRTAGVEQYADVPDKTRPWSEPQDCLQYLILGAEGRDAVIADSHETPGSRLSVGDGVQQFDDDFDLFEV